MRPLALITFVTLAWGCDDRLVLVVDVRTDLVPGAELGALSATLEDGSVSGRVDVESATDWLGGARVAELRVAPGTHTLIVTGFDPTERAIVERSVRVQVDVDSAVTVLLTRDCRGVVCGEAGAEACWAGTCVSEECTEESSGSCGEPECASASDCPVAGPCGSARCDLGACVFVAEGACGAAEFCDPEFGCRTIGDTGPVDGLIAHYRFDDDPSDGVQDSSGSERHGSCATCPALASGGPRGSYYLSFAADQLVTVPSDGVLETLQVLTAAGWVRIPTDTRSFRSFFGKPFGMGSGNSWELHIIDGLLRFSSESVDTGHSIPSLGPMPTDEWVHIAATVDGTTQTLYVNGMPQAETLAMPLAYDDSPLALVADVNGGSPSSELFGGVDDLRLYDRALSEAEVAELATP